MSTNQSQAIDGYFNELTIRLPQEGFTVQPENHGCLPVEWKDQPLCQITTSGSVRYRQEDMASQAKELALAQVTDLAGEVKEYMALMEQAPPLKADSLNDSYLLLADFNGTVLAAKRTQYGVHFATWDRDFDRKGLSHGHFFMADYNGAKQDFAVRSGLVDKHRILSDVQLSEVYRCVHETLESHYPMTAEREKLLKAVAEQIEYGVPNLNELVDQSNLKEMEVMDEGPSQDMIQQF